MVSRFTQEVGPPSAALQVLQKARQGGGLGDPELTLILLLSFGSVLSSQVRLSQPHTRDARGWRLSDVGASWAPGGTERPRSPPTGRQEHPLRSVTTKHVPRTRQGSPGGKVPV